MLLMYNIIPVYADGHRGGHHGGYYGGSQWGNRGQHYNWNRRYYGNQGWNRSYGYYGPNYYPREHQRRYYEQYGYRYYPGGQYGYPGFYPYYQQGGVIISVPGFYLDVR